ncbi:MAG: hypothetical protein Kow0013_00240 [Pararhodobacter sp.]
MSLTEESVLREIRRLTRRDLRLWVEAGWVRPALAEDGPRFDELDVARLRLLCDLRKDMALSAQAIPVILTLIDRLHQTRRDLHALLDALDGQPPDVRRSVMAQLRGRFAGREDR